MVEKILKRGIGKVLGIFDLVGALIDLGTIIRDTLKPVDAQLTRNTPIDAYANGGAPKKGNLFVAGEKGPELVTEHNGETVVMNEQQLKDRGISFYADGTNVPKAGRFHELTSGSMSADWENMTNGFEKAIDGLVNRFGSVSSIIDTTYVAFKKLTVVGIGTLLNSFNKFANSKSFQTLFKSAPEGGTTLQQAKAMGGMIKREH